MNPPIPMRWDGEAMVPLPHFGKAADRAFTIGEVYRLVEERARSTATHNHFFALVNEAWQNLPEADVERFPSSEHMRKWALIQTGYSTERNIVCSSRAEALRVAAFIKPIDEYAVVLVHHAVVRVLTAQSQSKNAMGGEVFAKSKQAVLDKVAQLIGVQPAALEKNAREAA